MPINLRHLTADSTWLLTITSPYSPPSHPPFTILLDPWLDGPSPVWHPKFSVQNHRIPASISSLRELKEPPNIVVISQDKSDHCHEATCRQLPNRGVKVYAVPGADKTVRSWKWFQPGEVKSLRPWNSRKGGRVERIPIYKYGRSGHVRGWEDAEKEGGDIIAAWIELTYLPALKPWEIPALHAAVGITYTPASIEDSMSHWIHLPPSPPHTPPATGDYFGNTSTYTRPSTGFLSLSSRSSPSSPSPSSKKLRLSPKIASFFPNSAPNSPESISSFRSAGSPTSPSTTHLPSYKEPYPKTDLTESIIYTPHGVPPSALTSYIQSIPLPLTLLLHCYDHVQNPFWLGGTISSGAPNAIKLLESLQQQVSSTLCVPTITTTSPTATTPDDEIGIAIGGQSDLKKHAFGVKYWVSTHDEEKLLGGWVSTYVRTKRWGMNEVEAEVRRIAQEQTDCQSPALWGNEKTSTKSVSIAGLQLLEMDVGEQRDLL